MCEHDEMTQPVRHGWTVSQESVHSQASSVLLRDYYEEIVCRYWQRPVSAVEVDAAMAEEASDHLVLPHGLFLLACLDNEPVGCAGVVLLDPLVAELKRVFIRPDARGSGGGGMLINAAESAAVALGARFVRLDTRSDLIEARKLYARHGYKEIPRYNDAVYAQHWFEKCVPDHSSPLHNNQLTDV